jgi:hypothetical protein
MFPYFTVTITEPSVFLCVYNFPFSFFAFFLQSFVVSLEERDTDELILVLKGYYFLLTGATLFVHKEEDHQTQGDLGKAFKFFLLTFSFPL